MILPLCLLLLLSVQAWSVYQGEHWPKSLKAEQVSKQVPLCRPHAGGGEGLGGMISLTMHRFRLESDREPISKGSLALWLLMGGPGKNGMNLPRRVIPRLLQALPPRSVIYVPRQRGTQFSSPLPMVAGSLVQSMQQSKDLLHGLPLHCYDQPQAIEDLQAWLEEYGHERNLLYGLSYGGSLAMAVAHHNPRVHGLLLDSTLLSNTSNRDAVLARLLADCSRHWACQHLFPQEGFVYPDTPLLAQLIGPAHTPQSFGQAFARMALSLELVYLVLESGQVMPLDLRSLLLRYLTLPLEPDLEETSSLRVLVDNIRFLLHLSEEVDGGLALYSLGPSTRPQVCVSQEGRLQFCPSTAVDNHHDPPPVPVLSSRVRDSALSLSSAQQFQVKRKGKHAPSYNLSLFAILIRQWLSPPSGLEAGLLGDAWQGLRIALEPFEWARLPPPQPIPTAVSVPTLLLVGELDYHAPMEEMASFAGAQMVRIERGGHLALEQLPVAQLRRLLESLLSDQQSPPPFKLLSLPPLDYLMVGVPESIFPRWRTSHLPWGLRLYLRAAYLHVDYPFWWLVLLVVMVTGGLTVWCLRWYWRRDEPQEICLTDLS